MVPFSFTDAEIEKTQKFIIKQVHTVPEKL